MRIVTKLKRRDMFSAHVAQTLQEQGVIGKGAAVPRSRQRGWFGRLWSRD